MPCITVMIPGYSARHRTKLEDGTGFTSTGTLIEKAIKQAAFDSAAALDGNKLTPDDFWVYLVGVPASVPATKFTIELLKRPERDQAWINALARNVGRAVTKSCAQYSKAVVGFTYQHDEDFGFCEIGGH